MPPTFSGIVSFHFSIASDILPGTRDVRIKIQTKTVSLSSVLDHLFQERNISPQIIAQHQLLAFLTDQSGTPVYYKDKDTPELRARALNVKTAFVSNYAQIELTLLKISAEQQRERDVTEQEDELLNSIESRGRKAQMEDDHNLMKLATTSTTSAPESTSATVTTNEENNKIGGTTLSVAQDIVDEKMQENLKRKTILMARRVPLRVNVFETGSINDPSSSSPQKNEFSLCLLCNHSIRRSKKVSSAPCPNPASQGKCNELCCDVCFDYAFKLKMMGMKCPICAGDKFGSIINNTDSLENNTTTALGNAAVESNSTTLGQNNESIMNNKLEKVSSGTTAVPSRRGATTTMRQNDDDDDDDEVVEVGKVRRIE